MHQIEVTRKGINRDQTKRAVAKEVEKNATRSQVQTKGHLKVWELNLPMLGIQPGISFTQTRPDNICKYPYSGWSENEADQKDREGLVWPHVHLFCDQTRRRMLYLLEPLVSFSLLVQWKWDAQSCQKYDFHKKAGNYYYTLP